MKQGIKKILMTFFIVQQCFSSASIKIFTSDHLSAFPKSVICDFYERAQGNEGAKSKNTRRRKKKGSLSSCKMQISFDGKIDLNKMHPKIEFIFYSGWKLGILVCCNRMQ